VTFGALARTADLPAGAEPQRLSVAARGGGFGHDADVVPEGYPLLHSDFAVADGLARVSGQAGVHLDEELQWALVLVSQLERFSITTLDGETILARFVSTQVADPAYERALPRLTRALQEVKTAQVWPPASGKAWRHGAPQAPCESCAQVLSRLGVVYH
jgi:hypothetical protein